MDEDFLDDAGELLVSLLSQQPRLPEGVDEPLEESGQRHVPRGVALLIIALILGIPLLLGAIWLLTHR